LTDYSLQKLKPEQIRRIFARIEIIVTYLGEAVKW